MADNDIYVIKKIIKNFTTTDETISERDRISYENIIADVIYKQILNEEFKYSTYGMPDFVAENFKIRAKNYAKAVVDRLFGEGE